MSDSASRSAAASDVSGSSRLPSTIEKSHLADSGNDSFISSDCELSAGGGDHSRESPQPQPARHTSAPLQDHLVHATADLASLAENDDRSRENISEILLIKVTEHYDDLKSSAILTLHLMFSFSSVFALVQVLAVVTIRYIKQSGITVSC